MSYQFFDSVIYIVVCISVSATTFLLAETEQFELPIRGVFPVNATVSPNYEVIFAIEIYAIIINCWWVYSFDVVLLSLVRWMTIDLEILQLNYRQCPLLNKPRGTLMVSREGFDAIKNYNFINELKNDDEIYSFVPFNEDQVYVKEDSFLKRFTSCLIHQRQVIKNVKDVNNLFSVVLAIQTISNCTLTCMGLFGLVGVRTNKTGATTQVSFIFCSSRASRSTPTRRTILSCFRSGSWTSFTGLSSGTCW